MNTTGTGAAQTSRSDRAKQRMRRIAVSFLAVAVVCTISILFVDHPVAWYLYRDWPPQSREFWRILSDVGLGQYWYGLGALALVGGLLGLKFSRRFTYRRLSYRIADAAAFAITALTLSGLSVVVLKQLFGRLRPKYLLNHDTAGFDPFSLDFGALSFPSGHSQTIFAAMVSLYLIYPGLKWAYFGIAIVVAAARVLSTKHFASDAILGSYIGAAGTVLLYWWWERRRTTLKLARFANRFF